MNVRSKDYATLTNAYMRFRIILDFLNVPRITKIFLTISLKIDKKETDKVILPDENFIYKSDVLL